MRVCSVASDRRLHYYKLCYICILYIISLSIQSSAENDSLSPTAAPCPSTTALPWNSIIIVAIDECTGSQTVLLRLVATNNRSLVTRTQHLYLRTKKIKKQYGVMVCYSHKHKTTTLYTVYTDSHCTLYENGTSSLTKRTKNRII